ncbi:MAG: threonine synthase, partial [Planctomycetes bacterium]|nr:threonine synthase [Planctomycetota bacterium]
MKYISTRGEVRPIGFEQAVLMGLADDGGLLIPETIPSVADSLHAWSKLDYTNLALELFDLYIDDIPRGDLKEIVVKTYSADVFEPVVAPLVKVGDIYLLELWHGPTLAFKDVALQFLGNIFEYILSKRDAHLNILVATSGDTGSAAIAAVRGKERMNIFVMHPKGRISPIQQRQMTTVLDENVHNIAIEGDFDDCQRIMKTLAADLDFKRKYSLGAVNSVNWARLLAQMVYYFWAYFRLADTADNRELWVEVPTGNFGNILAGWYAKQMGLPIDKLILATNENDILARFFQSGEYRRGKLIQTLAPSMDIQVASNFERYLYYRIGQDSEKLREMIRQFSQSGVINLPKREDEPIDDLFLAGKANRDEALETIRKYYQQYDYLLDPHTAVGVAVAEKMMQEGTSSDGKKVVCLSTAHPAKFPEAIR